MSEANVEIARRGYEAFNRSGVEGILEYLHDDVEWKMWERFARGPRTYHGHSGVREVLAVFDENYEETQIEPLEFIEEGDRVIVPVRFHCKVKGTREEEIIELVQVWTTRGSRAARLEAYADKEEAFAALEPSAE